MRNPIKSTYWQKAICLLVIVTFALTSFNIPLAQAQDFQLPKPGVRVSLSPPVNPVILKGIKVHPDNPFQFEFIMDQGDVGAQHAVPLRDEANRLIKYFLASLTVPEKDLWVNLSPYEKDRIVPESFGLTEMGRDLLAEDYMLKQITASLIYPEDEVGKKFWKRIYEEAAKKYNTTNIPVNTFNKVWIVPDKAVVYERQPQPFEAKGESTLAKEGKADKSAVAYVVESRLKVMLEADYLAESKNGVGATPRGRPQEGQAQRPAPTDTNTLGNNIIREIVIPELTREVNEGANFAQLRQVYNSLILATWYKKKIKDSILAQVYADKNKIQGLSSPNVFPPKADPPLAEIGDPGTSASQRLVSLGLKLDSRQKRSGMTDVEMIYQRYLQAFKKGVYNYIKEEADPITQQPVPRKYFSGGMNISPDQAMTITTNLPQNSAKNLYAVGANLSSANTTDASQLAVSNPYHKEGYVTRPLKVLEIAYSITEDLDAKKNVKQDVLLIGVGRGVAAMEMALKYPKVNIIAVNKEGDLWNDEYLIKIFKQSGYSEERIQEARARITVQVFDISQAQDRAKVLGQAKFDLVIFETGVLMYIRDKLKIIEEMFNGYVRQNGIFAFESTLIEYKGKFLSEITRIIEEAFQRAGSVIRKSIVNKELTAFIKTRKQSEKTLKFNFVLNPRKTLEFDNGHVQHYASFYDLSDAAMSVEPNYPNSKSETVEIKRNTVQRDFFSRILRQITWANKIRTITQASQISKQDLRDLTTQLRNSDHLGRILQISSTPETKALYSTYKESVFQYEDWVVVFRWPGSTQDGLGLKDLNDVLGQEQVNALIQYVRSFLKLRMLKAPKTLNEKQRQEFLDAISYELSNEMAYKLRNQDPYRTELLKRSVRVRDNKGQSLFKIDIGISHLATQEQTDPTKIAQSKVLAVMNAELAIVVNNFASNSADQRNVFNEGKFFELIERWQDLKQQLPQAVFDAYKGQKVLQDDIVGMLRRKVAWSSLAQPMQETIGSERNYQLLNDYFVLTGLVDFIKQWQLDFKLAYQRSFRVQELIRQLGEMSSMIGDDQRLPVNDNRGSILAEAWDLVLRDSKFPTADSELGFFNQATYEGPVGLIMVDIINMGGKNIREYQLLMQEIAQALKTQKRDKISELLMSAADAVTEEFQANVSRLQAFLSQQRINLLAIKIRGDDIVLVVDDYKKITPELLIQIQQLTNGRVFGTQAIDAFRKSFEGRTAVTLNEFRNQPNRVESFAPHTAANYLAWAQALDAMDRGINYLKDLEKKEQGRRVIIENGDLSYQMSDLPELDQAMSTQSSAKKREIAQLRYKVLNPGLGEMSVEDIRRMKKIESWGYLTEKSLAGADRILLAYEDDQLVGAQAVEIDIKTGTLAVGRGISVDPQKRNREIAIQMNVKMAQDLQDMGVETFVISTEDVVGSPEFKGSQALARKVAAVFARWVKTIYVDNEKKNIIRQNIINLTTFDPKLADITTPSLSDGAMSTQKPAQLSFKHITPQGLDTSDEDVQVIRKIVSWGYMNEYSLKTVSRILLAYDEGDELAGAYAVDIDFRTGTLAIGAGVSVAPDKRNRDIAIQMTVEMAKELKDRGVEAFSIRSEDSSKSAEFVGAQALARKVAAVFARWVKTTYDPDNKAIIQKNLIDLTTFDPQAVDINTPALPDAAMRNTGGIDLTSNEFLQTQGSGKDISFNVDPAMLKQLQNAPGFYPVIFNIQPLTDLHAFLGANLQATH